MHTREGHTVFYLPPFVTLSFTRGRQRKLHIRVDQCQQFKKIQLNLSKHQMSNRSHIIRSLNLEKCTANNILYVI